MREFEQIIKEIDFRDLRFYFDIDKAKSEFDLDDEKAATLLLHSTGVPKKVISAKLEIAISTVESHITSWRNQVEEATGQRPLSPIDQFHLLRKSEIIQLPIDKFK